MVLRYPATAAVWAADVQMRIDDHGAGRDYGWVLVGSPSYVCSYVTPNDSIRSFCEKMDDLEDTLCEMEGYFKRETPGRNSTKIWPCSP